MVTSLYAPLGSPALLLVIVIDNYHDIRYHPARLEPMALYPGRTRERGRISSWAAEQRAMENNSSSLQRQTKDICKGARRRGRAGTWAPDQGERVWDGEHGGDRPWRESLSTGASPQASAGGGRRREGYQTDVRPPCQDIPRLTLESGGSSKS